MTKPDNIAKDLARIANALERLSPKPAQIPDFSYKTGEATGYLWEGETKSFTAIKQINYIELNLLIGIDDQKQKLLNNTRAFAKKLPANNALLWGARGMGKSSLIKSIHNKVSKEVSKKKLKHPLILIEILREDITTLNECLRILKNQDAQFILFCDDLSFEPNDASYKSLKAMLEGGISGRPSNVIFYATSNQRHLLARDQSEYNQKDYIHNNDLSNEKISLSDRFGLWLGFYNCDKAHYDEIVKTYAKDLDIKLDTDELIKRAHLWTIERGSRSGRVARQFIEHLMGELGAE
jgi:predicted AAA+ superfamily ATPase